MARGPSTAAKKAAEYLKKNPSTPASDLAKKFGINTATIYRAQWWKEAQEARNG